MLVCRNTLMYFNVETQAQIVDRFHFALKEEGILFPVARSLLSSDDLATVANRMEEIEKEGPR